MDVQSRVRPVTTLQFDALLNEHSLVFVDFWAPWCSPCKQFARIYEKVAEQFPEIVFVNINIEEEQELAESFHVRSIPHLMVVKQNVVIYSEAGSMPQSTLTELVQQALAADVSQIRQELDQ